MDYEIFVRHFQVETHFWSEKLVLVGYIDSDMARDVDNRRSTSGYLMTFSGGAVS